MVSLFQILAVIRFVLVLALIVGGAFCLNAQQFLLGPQIVSMQSASGQEILVVAQIPAGYRHVVLESAQAKGSTTWMPLVAGALSGDVTQVQFRVPIEAANGLLRITAGIDESVPTSEWGAESAFFELVEGRGGDAIPKAQRSGHVLSRLAYGPSERDYQKLRSEGISAWITQQMAPGEIDESANEALRRHESRLFEKYVPGSGVTLVSPGDTWRYFKGRSEPPEDWAELSFEDDLWSSGASGIGYGDDDDTTILTDMRRSGDEDGYLSVYVRKKFTIAEPSSLTNLFLEIAYDDGFVAYLNGQEVARANVEGSAPAFDDSAREPGGSVDNDVQM